MEKEQEEVEEENEYLYVYGITNKNVKLEMKGLKDRPIEKINYNDISALTSSYPTLNPVLKEDEAMQHADILKKIAGKITIIPMAFGTVFNDQEILEIILTKSYKAIKETIALIDNKIELGVKIIKQRKSEIFVDLKTKFSNNQLDNIELDNIDNGIALEILESLNKLSIKNVKGDNFSERLLLNHSFLVEKNKFSKFSDKIAELENKHKNLKFIYTGPWPPYSFVNIKISGS